MKKKLNLVLLTVSLAIVGWLSFDMAQLGRNQQLWGYRPLFLFAFSWAAIILVGSRFFLRSRSQRRWTLLSTLSGILLSVGFPGIIPLPILMFVGFVPLLLLEYEISKKEARPFWPVLRYAYHTFVVWNILTTYWVANSALAAGVFAIMVNALLMCIPFMLFHLTRKVMPRLGFFGLIAYWLTFEYNHLNWELTWPWLTLGNSFAEYPSLVQWYEYTGVFGGGLWIWVINILLFRKLIERGEDSRSIWRPDWKWGQIALILVLPVVLSLSLYYGYEERGNPAQIAVVQPNYEPHYVKFTVPVQLQMTNFLQLSNSVVDEETDYLVFPESSFGYVETHAIGDYPAVRRLDEYISAFPDLKLVTGLNAYTRFLPGETHTINTRMNVGSRGDTTYYETLNIAAQLSNERDSIQIYKKSKLVPGPEIFPYQHLLSVFKPIVDQLGGTTEGVGTQPHRTPFNSSGGQVAPVICYESVFGEYFTGYVKRGAEAAFIVTNDGWWDNTAGHRQHLNFASLRSIETRRAIARSANSGISGFINQRGDIIQRSHYDEATALKGTIYFNNAITFYVQWGDIIARIALFSSIMLVLNLVAKTWQRRVVKEA